MANKYKYRVNSLDLVTRELFEQAINAAMGDDNTSSNPLFPNGDSWYVYGKFVPKEESDDGEWHRVSQVSFRNYCGNCEMLITDVAGNFIIYTKIDGLSRSDLIDEYYREFILVRHLIDSEIKDTFNEEKSRMYKNNLDTLFGTAQK